MPINPNWMSELPNHMTLNNVIMPGSHDAGLYVSTGSPMLSEPFDDAMCITQDLDILKQLLAGSRYFDLRIYNNGFVFDDLRIGHFFEPVGKGHALFGKYGPKLSAILRQVLAFFDGSFMEYTGRSRETVILRFSHVSSGNAKKVVKMVQQILGPYLITPRSGVNLAYAELGLLRGKVIALFDHVFKENFGEKGVTAYSKNPESGRGLNICGEFSNTLDFMQLYSDQREKLMEHQQHSQNHLFQLYWTLTANRPCTSVLNITQPITEDFHNSCYWLNKCVKGIIYRPNIILIDFMDSNKASQIIELNGQLPITVVKRTMV